MRYFKSQIFQILLQKIEALLVFTQSCSVKHSFYNKLQFVDKRISHAEIFPLLHVLSRLLKLRIVANTSPG